jgi:Zn-dependent protease with chaperone function
MGQGQPPRKLLCPVCGTRLKPHFDGSESPGGPDLDLAPGSDGHRMICPECGEIFRARRRAKSVEESGSSGPASEPPLVGSLELLLRGAALLGIELTYKVGVFVGTGLLMLFGGFVPVTRAWLRDEIDDWGGAIETLGGVRVVTETRDPDADLGPVLDRTDAPALFSAVNDVARRLGAKPPGQIRLTYLPCCGVVAWGRSRALILGLPLLRVLTLAEFRAVLAHELAHLARGDATRAARLARFVAGLQQALDRAEGQERGPLGFLARTCCRAASWLIGPIARGQEARADRSAASIAGGSAAASALVKVALVQPLFREILDHYDPSDADGPNLYAFFRAFWFRLPAESHTAMRLHLLTSSETTNDSAHPPLPDRLALLLAYPDPAVSHSGNDNTPATTFLGDLEGFEQMLHNRLFALPPVEPSVFHKAGT